MACCISLWERTIYATEAQNLGTLRGKILRINPDGTIPSDNPFVQHRLSAPFSLSIALAIAIASGSRSIPIQTTYGRQRTVRTTMIRLIGSLPGGIMDGLFVQEFAAILCTLIRSSPSPPPLRQPGSSQSEKIPSIRRSITTTYCSPISTSANFIESCLVELGLTDFSSHTIACNCGQGGLIAVMHGLNVPGQDGYIYVSNAQISIFRVVLN